MKVKSIVMTTVVALGLAVSAQANAEESAVQRLMGSLIANAVSVTQAEIATEVQQNIANTTYHLSLTDLPVGKVSVTEIASVTQSKEDNSIAE